MDTLQARLLSFSKSSKRTKPLNKSISGSLKWPHPATFKATPSTLAEAGFYYNPTTEYRDNVSCFMCEKELADWDKDDDPFSTHWDKCTNTCPWAMVRCSLLLDMNEDGSYTFTGATRLPSSKTMEKARLETYTMHQTWPHDSVRGHGANSKKMAKAGFVYTPQTAGDDTATCFYCGISLSGWDDDDDPMDEHRKREERTRVACPFFASVASVASTTKVTSKPPSRVSSKPPSRVASQSKINPRAVVDADPEGSDEEETVAQPSKPVGSRGKKSTASGSSSAPGTATAPRRATRSKSAKGKTAEASEDEDVEVGGSESETGTKVSKAKRKGKATGKAHMESVQEEKVEADIEEGEGEADVEAEPEPAKPKRGRPPAAKKATTSSRKKKAPDDTETQPVSTSTTKHTRTRSKANLQSDVEVEDYKQPPTKTRVTSSKKPPTPATVAPESVAQKSQTKTRKSSSTSDDAGYATAELQMDVDAVQEGPRHDTKTSDHDAVLENHDRDSGLAESIGQSSPPKHSSPPIESSSRREVSAQNTPALQSVASSNKAKKGKAKMQMEVAMLMSPPRQSSSAPMDTDDDVPTINYTTQSLQNGVTFSSATSSSSAPQPTGPSTPKSKTVQFLPATPEPDPPAPSESHLPDSVMPFLANMPTEKLSYLTEDESAMTIEQYIRREIEVQYQRFKEDGERKIALFQEKVAETRRIIESL